MRENNYFFLALKQKMLHPNELLLVGNNGSIFWLKKGKLKPLKIPGLRKEELYDHSTESSYTA